MFQLPLLRKKTTMSHSEEARKLIGDLSKENIDDLVRPSSLTIELEEVCTRLNPRTELSIPRQSEAMSTRN